MGQQDLSNWKKRDAWLLLVVGLTFASGGVRGLAIETGYVKRPPRVERGPLSKRGNSIAGPPAVIVSILMVLLGRAALRFSMRHLFAHSVPIAKYLRVESILFRCGLSLLMTSLFGWLLYAYWHRSDPTGTGPPSSFPRTPLGWLTLAAGALTVFSWWAVLRIFWPSKTRSESHQRYDA